MHFKQIIRANPITGETERPWRNRTREFVLGDPAKGDVRHHDTNAVKVDNYGEALDLVERGFLIRMSDGKSPASLVTPTSLSFIDEPVRTIDDLWTFSMPDVPFSREQLEQELRSALLVHAGEIHWLASQAAADAFIGFPLDVDEVEGGTQAGNVDLTRFNFARVVMNAYESAFRTGFARPLSEEDVDELELLLGAVSRGPTRRHPSPADRPDSALRTTMLSAYLRWKMSEGALFNNKLDQSAVENLAVLAGMSEQAVRNSLNKEGLSPVKGKIDYDAVIRWLEQRRDFVPLREDERPEGRSTWAALHLLKTIPVRTALDQIRGRHQRPRDARALAGVEERIAQAVEQGSSPSRSDIRAYARHLGLAIDTLVLNFDDAAAQARQK